ncbi:MAG: hypothetical protein JEY91_15595, partial [Spirochaetaceae bacterium]|nr:hypothetical protein [Spirochaetaceae bacterium]
MNELRIILYLIIFVVSLYNLITFYSRKKKVRKLADKEKEGMISSRSLTEEESQALKVLHKISLPAGTPVYVLNDSYSSESISIKGGSVTTHYIGAFHLLWDEIFPQYLQETNMVEIVFTDKNKGCLIVSMNERYSAVKEAEIRNKLSHSQLENRNTNKFTTSTLHEATMAVDTGDALFRITRKASEEEKRFLSSDLRFSACLGVFAGLLLLTLAPSKTISIPGLIVLIPSLVLLFIRVNPLGKNRFRENLVSIKGVLKSKGHESLNEYFIDRFKLEFPPRWGSDIPLDREVTVEGYPLGKELSSIKVLSINTGRSVQMDELKSPSKKYSRFVLMVVFLIINLIIQFSTNGGIKNVERLITYLSTRNLQKTFHSFDEIRDYNFVRGQEVSFLDQKIVPRFVVNENGFVSAMGNLLVPEETPINFKIDDVENRLASLISLQLTEEIFSMTAFRSADTTEYYDFLISYSELINGKLLSDFSVIFNDNSHYRELIKMSDFLFSEDDSETDITSNDIVSLLNDFFSRETEILNNMISDALKNTISAKEAIAISTTEYHDDLYSLRTADLMAFNRDSSYLSDNTLKYISPLYGETTLANLYSYMSSCSQLVDLQGIIRGEMDKNDTIPRIGISYEDSYSDLKNLYIKSILIIISILLLIVFLYKSISAYKWNSSRSS